jgi:hypothetical protein
MRGCLQIWEGCIVYTFSSLDSSAYVVRLQLSSCVVQWPVCLYRVDQYSYKQLSNRQTESQNFARHDVSNLYINLKTYFLQKA